MIADVANRVEAQLLNVNVIANFVFWQSCILVEKISPKKDLQSTLI